MLDLSHLIIVNNFKALFKITLSIKIPLFAYFVRLLRVLRKSVTNGANGPTNNTSDPLLGGIEWFGGKDLFRKFR